MNRADRYLTAGILVAALVSLACLYWGRFLHPAGNGGTAVIRVHGRPVRSIALAEGKPSASFTVPGRIGTATVVVEGTRIRISEAPCTERICVHRGWIGRPGESIVCIPNEIEIAIEGGAPYDAVTR